MVSMYYHCGLLVLSYILSKILMKFDNLPENLLL